MGNINILEVNNIDLPGRRFNGYDLLDVLNEEKGFNCKQIVVYKQSNDKRVEKFFNDYVSYDYFHRLMEFENRISIHSNLSLTSPTLIDSKSYQEADIVHFHMFHNTRISLYSLIRMCKEKKVVLSFHDPWPITGRCVHFRECNKWKEGCKNCENLGTLFEFTEDNCEYMWKLKELVYKNIDPDIIVHSKYMLDLVKTSPLTKHFKKVHFIPFGVNLDLFSNKITQKEARNKLGIEEEGIVLLFRNQAEFKGVSYIKEAMNKLCIDKKIILLTCDGETGLEDLKEKYTVKELGLIDSEDLVYAYNACDIFLMPSIGESFGMMAVEAMACSKPVIIFNNTALPSVTFAPECGFLVENKNSKELMSAIEYLIKEPEERIKRGELGRELCKKNYDINKYNNDIMELYKKIYKTKHKKDLCRINTKKIDLEDKDVKNVMSKLNKFTQENFNKNSEEYKYLINICDSDSNGKVDYSKIDVQKVIEIYNQKLYKVLNKKQYEKKHTKVEQIKQAIKLLIKDRKRLKNSIQYKLNQIFKKKDK